MNFTVTIARQLGSGGSEIGRDLANALGVRCIDREIISQTALQLDLLDHEIAAREERVMPFWERMLTGFVVGAPEAAYVPPPVLTPSDSEIFEAETQVLKTIALQESCVIVGRAAGHVLPPHPRMISVLLYAPLEVRIERVMRVHAVATPAQARAKIAYSDSMRGKSIAQMTGHDWMAAENYHLCLDSSALPFSDTTRLLCEFVRGKIGVEE